MKRPQQERSRATVEAILTAATHILCEEIAANFTTNKVAEEAGVSIGSLYQYFPNKEALLKEICRRYESDLIDAIHEVGVVAQGTTIRETVKLFVAAHIKARMISPKLYAVLKAYYTEEDSVGWFSAYKAELTRIIATHLSHRPRTANLKRLESIAFVLFGAVDGPLSEALESHHTLLEDGILETQLTTMITAYLVELTGHPADV